MANKKTGIDNLIPTNQRSKDEARALGEKGGIASGEARRRKRDIRIALEMLLEKDFIDEKGNEGSGAELMALKMFEKAIGGDTKAFELVRDTAGQKPIEKVSVESEATEKFAEVLETWHGKRDRK